MTVLKAAFILIFALVWIYVLSVCNRAKLSGWFFIIGTVGCFCLLTTVFTEPFPDILSALVSLPARLIGGKSGFWTAVLNNERLYLVFERNTFILQMDADGSGFTELSIFLSVAAFFKVYSLKERTFAAAIGGLFVVLSASFRIFTVCLLTFLIGEESFYVIHGVVGRLLFFALNVLIYYNVFTRAHINRIGIGNFNYAFSESVE